MSPSREGNRYIMPYGFERPVEGREEFASLLDEAGRMRAFVPPFRFTSFFSPEDTLLCAIASEAALAHARSLHRHEGRSLDPLRIVELTTGSGLVGFHLLRLEGGSRLTGIDIDSDAVETAERNARVLDLSARARFECSDLWSGATKESLESFRPHLLICNPPYIPEPPGLPLELEAGAGPDGTAHLLRTIDLASETSPRAMALSWCSLSDPVGIVEAAAGKGYALNSLFVVAITDGEYSGSVHSYLKTLPRAWMNEESAAVDAVAPDGSGRFAYLLMAGDFSRTEGDAYQGVDAVRQICERFSGNGLEALRISDAGIPIRSWLLDRWDELKLRVFLHGSPESTSRRRHA
ncbi:MAG: methyltransferase [Gemmatimonadaceae bacterium]